MLESLLCGWSGVEGFLFLSCKDYVALQRGLGETPVTVHIMKYSHFSPGLNHVPKGHLSL